MRLSLRTVLLGSLLAILVATVGTVAAVSHTNSKDMVDDLAGHTKRQTADRIHDQIRSLLDRAVLVSDVNVNEFEGRKLSYESFESVTNHFYESMALVEELSYLSLSLPTGDYCHVDRKPGAERLAIVTRRRLDDHSLLHRYEIENGKRKLLYETKDEYDPRVRPFYKQAAEAKRRIWTDVYAFFNSPEPDYPGLSLATPVYDPDTKALAGVFTADFNMVELGRFLEGLPIFDNGTAFLVEVDRQGVRHVIAHPNSSLLLKTEPDEKGNDRSVLRRIDEIESPVVRAFLAQVPSHGDRHEHLQRLEFSVGDDDYVGAYDPLVSRHGLDWHVAIVVPRDDLMKQADRNIETTLLIGALSLILALLLGIYLAGRVSRPVRALVDQTEKIAKMRLDPAPEPSSRFEEIAQLGAAMEEMKTGLRSFGKYVPADLVREMLESGAEAKLGGERSTLTIYFSDIEGFTSIAEKLDPEDLVALLGEYLEEMSRGVASTGGTVDKYIGDAVMAFWGAPNDDPSHAQNACAAALENQRRLAVLREDWRARGQPELRARIGISSGEVIVGNLGSESRLNYTVIGDTANLASRLEALNKFYGTSILISAATHGRVKRAFVARPLERVTVKGKEEGGVVYELLGEAGAVDDDTLRLVEAATVGLERFHSRKFEEAITAYEEVLRLRTGDALATLMIDSCRAYLETAPPPGWDGVRRMTKK